MSTITAPAPSGQDTLVLQLLIAPDTYSIRRVPVTADVGLAAWRVFKTTPGQSADYLVRQLGLAPFEPASYRCDCPAGRNNLPRCKHRRAVIALRKQFAPDLVR